MQYLQEQEHKKMLERYQRSMLKGKEVEKEHKFWNTQPVPGILEEVTEGNGPINPLMTPDQVKQDEYNMPAGFEWCSIDVNDPAQVQEIYNLLNENYVEDDDCMFRSVLLSVQITTLVLSVAMYFTDSIIRFHSCSGHSLHLVLSKTGTSVSATPRRVH